MLIGKKFALGFYCFLNFRIFSINSLSIRFSQGENFIVATLLMFLDEEESFWMLIALMNGQRWNMREVMRPGFPGLLEHLVFHYIFYLFILVKIVKLTIFLKINKI